MDRKPTKVEEETSWLRPDDKEIRRKLVLVTREEWRAIPPVSQEAMEVPIKFIITQSTDTDSCGTPEECLKEVQRLQRHHITRMGLPDITSKIGFNKHSYNQAIHCFSFLVGGDGRVYEGRGWKTIPLANKNYPDLYGKSIEIAIIGKKGVIPSKQTGSVINDLVDYGKSLGVIAEKTGLFPIHE